MSKVMNYDKRIEQLNSQLEKYQRKCKQISEQIEILEQQREERELSELLKVMRKNNLSIGDIENMIKK